MTADRLEIRPLAAQAAAAGPERCRLGALYEACFDEPGGEAAMAVLLASPGSRGLVARRDADGLAREVGFVIFRQIADEAEILSLGVTPAARRRGVGGALLAAAVAELSSAGAAAVYLEVGEDNRPARAIYEKAGFLPVGRRPEYYRRSDRRPVAAVVMRKSNKRT